MAIDGPKVQGQIESIQAFRGIASSLVVFHHVCLCLLNYGDHHSVLASHKGIRWFGACGVDLFFVISGFVMIVATATKPAAQRSVVTFIKLRLIRIVPLYWIYTTCVLLLFLLPFAFTNTKAQYTWSYIVKSYLFIPAMSPAGFIQPLLAQGWTLIYELFFYFVFAGFLRTNSDFAATCISLLFCCLTITGFVVAPTNPIALFFTDSILIEFCFGMVAGIVYLRARNIPKAVLFGAFGVSIAAFVWAIVQNADQDYRVVYWGVPAFGLLISATLLEKQRIIESWCGILLWFGECSYSIYLTHGFVLLPFCAMLRRVSLTSGYADTALVCMFVVAILPGMFSYRFLEKPLTEALKNVIVRRSRRRA